MKTHKIIKKLKELHLIGKITIEVNGKITSSVKNNKLTDYDLKKLQEFFPRKKYDITIKTQATDLVLEISKVRNSHRFIAGSINCPPIWSAPFPSFHFDPCGMRSSRNF